MGSILFIIPSRKIQLIFIDAWSKLLIMKQRFFLILGCITFFTMPLYSSIDLVVKCHTDTLNKNVDLQLDITRGAGFFCEMFKVVSSLIHFEDQGFNSVFINWKNRYFPYKDDFSDEINGWDLFFEPIILENKETVPSMPVGGEGFHELHSDCSDQWIKYNINLPYRRYVKKIIDKYIKIKPFILDKVDSFYNKNMKGYVCIGLHVRHSMHVANRASLQEYAQEVNHILAQHKNDKVKIFIASDSYEPIRYFSNIYGAQAIYSDALRKEKDFDPVFDSPNYKIGFAGGVGALTDCLLLSKCDYFIHITSHVSNFVSFFNPNIKSIYIPRKRPYQRCHSIGLTNLKNPYINLVN